MACSAFTRTANRRCFTPACSPAAIRHLRGFVPNERDDAQDWFFRGFSTRDGLGLGDILQGYEELPVRPRFITRAEQAFYAPQSGVPECDWPRLLAENVSRILRQLIHDATDDRILLPDLRDVGKEAYMDC